MIRTQDGRLLRLDPAASGALFQLCNGTYESFDAAFNFATRYKKKCNIAARELFERPPESTQFFNIYIPYEIQVGTNFESRLFAIPMLILNRPNNQVIDFARVKTNEEFLRHEISSVKQKLCKKSF
jgi:hypothetical protein